MVSNYKEKHKNTHLQDEILKERFVQEIKSNNIKMMVVEYDAQKLYDLADIRVAEWNQCKKIL